MPTACPCEECSPDETAHEIAEVVNQIRTRFLTLVPNRVRIPDSEKHGK
jgi:hypothetical protein